MRVSLFNVKPHYVQHYSIVVAILKLVNILFFEIIKKILFTLYINSNDAFYIHFTHIMINSSMYQHTLYNFAKFRRHFEICRHFD